MIADLAGVGALLALPVLLLVLIVVIVQGGAWVWLMTAAALW